MSLYIYLICLDNKGLRPFEIIKNVLHPFYEHKAKSIARIYEITCNAQLINLRDWDPIEEKQNYNFNTFWKKQSFFKNK